ncbi:MAG: putative F420-dependent oxidoreductase [Halioglobus sp.]|jgi:probable F420-dependent oxidoreductase
MKFWQSLAFVEMDQTVELAKFCEQLGFHGVSYGDHLITTQAQIDQYLYTDDGNILWNPDTHWPDPWVLSAALAQATSTLEFLSTIYILPLRDPFSAAKAVSCAAVLSSDRVTLGIGVGWQKTEFDMVGQNFHTRGKRTDESLQILRALMSGETCEFHGDFYDFEPVKMSPGTNKPVPILVGGYSPAAMKRAAGQDGWLAVSHEEEEIYPLLDQLAAVREARGDAERDFDIWSGVKNPGPETHARLAQAGVTMVNGTNFFDQDGKTVLSTIDCKKRRLETFAKEFLA